jgi:hypothetical protein
VSGFGRRDTAFLSEKRPGVSERVIQPLERRFGCEVRILWTENRCAFLSLRPRGDHWVLRLDRSFQAAPEPVWEAIGAFLVTGRRGHLGPARAHFQRNRRALPAGRRAPRVEPQGRVYHLGDILDEVVAQSPFSAVPPVAISWGRRVRPGRRRLQLGSYQPGEPPLIRLHPVLDDARVPRFAVGQVVHHELVHHVLTVTGGLAQGRSHGPRFQELEALFPEHRRAAEWTELGLPGLFSRPRRG